MDLSEPVALRAARARVSLPPRACARVRDARPAAAAIAAACGVFGPAFLDGYDAFALGIDIIDDPYFAEPDRADDFDAWSDGWHTALDATLPVPQRLLTALNRPHNGSPPARPWHDLRGVTASWGSR